MLYNSLFMFLIAISGFACAADKGPKLSASHKGLTGTVSPHVTMTPVADPSKFVRPASRFVTEPELAKEAAKKLAVCSLAPMGPKFGDAFADHCQQQVFEDYHSRLPVSMGHVVSTNPPSQMEFQAERLREFQAFQAYQSRVMDQSLRAQAAFGKSVEESLYKAMQSTSTRPY